jgi:hypothetical protein
MPFGTAATHAHKFTLGQDLVFMPGADFFIRVPARCKVTRLLPKDGPEYQYHIQTEPDGQQRRAQESQLLPAT